MSAESYRIALTVDPEIPVPPKHYGGIERVVDMLVRGLMERGHQVTLFAHGDSSVPCKVESYPANGSRGTLNLIRNLSHVSARLLREDFDVVHSFGRLAYLLPVLPLSTPKIMSYQRGITPRSVAWGNRLSRGTLHFTGCSKNQMRDYAKCDNWHAVYNGVPATSYQCRKQVDADAPLVFLGRVEKIKGPHVAIRVAQRSGRKLRIAGNVPVGAEHQAFFESEIQPHLNGDSIVYVGPVDDIQKNTFLGQAAALIFPIEWAEPFGIVMAEALACGTPVLAFPKGSAPEVVQHGVNGFLCQSEEEMVTSVSRIGEIDRGECRRVFEERFSDRAIVDDYVNLYRSLIQKNGTHADN